MLSTLILFSTVVAGTAYKTKDLPTCQVYSENVEEFLLKIIELLK